MLTTRYVPESKAILALSAAEAAEAAANENAAWSVAKAAAKASANVGAFVGAICIASARDAQNKRLTSMVTKAHIEQENSK